MMACLHTMAISRDKKNILYDSGNHVKEESYFIVKIFACNAFLTITMAFPEITLTGCLRCYGNHTLSTVTFTLFNVAIISICTSFCFLLLLAPKRSPIQTKSKRKR